MITEFYFIFFVLPCTRRCTYNVILRSIASQAADFWRFVRPAASPGLSNSMLTASSCSSMGHSNLASISGVYSRVILRALCRVLCSYFPSFAEGHWQRSRKNGLPNICKLKHGGPTRLELQGRWKICFMIMCELLQAPSLAQRWLGHRKRAQKTNSSISFCWYLSCLSMNVCNNCLILFLYSETQYWFVMKLKVSKQW